MSARRLSILAGAVLLLAGGARAQDAATHERWVQLSEQERELYRERFDRLRDMDPEERGRLDERAAVLGDLKRLVLERLDPEQKARLASLPPEQRREVLHDHVLQELLERGERIREKLPTDVLQELESAPPAERERLLHELRRRMRGGPGGKPGYERMCRGMELPPQELERLDGMPPEQRVEEVLRLRMEHMLARATEQDRPGFELLANEWARLRELSPRAFFEELHRLGVRTGGEGRGAEPEVRLDFGVRRRIEDALRPTLEDLIETNELERFERFRLIGERLRPRVLEVIRSEHVLSDEQFAELASLTGLEFAVALEQKFGLHGPRDFGGRSHRDGGHDERDGRGWRGGWRDRLRDGPQADPPGEAPGHGPPPSVDRGDRGERAGDGERRPRRR